MTKNKLKSIEMMQQAVTLAARAHQGQFRRDGRTPYFAHPVRVCLTLTHLFAVRDPRILTAALLHDLLEDTTVSSRRLERTFGKTILAWVRFLSKNRKLPSDKRENRYQKQLASAPAEAKVIKLADMYDNLCDASLLPTPKKLIKAKKRVRSYLEAMKATGMGPYQKQFRVVEKRLLQSSSGLKS